MSTTDRPKGGIVGVTDQIPERDWAAEVVRDLGYAPCRRQRCEREDLHAVGECVRKRDLPPCR
jgi:hypothetical protein